MKRNDLVLPKNNLNIATNDWYLKPEALVNLRNVLGIHHLDVCSDDSRNVTVETKHVENIEQVKDNGYGRRP